MKFRPQLLFSLLIVLFFAYFIYAAQGWRLQAKLYPWAIGIPMLVLAVAHFILELKGGARKKDSADAVPVDFQFTQTIEPALARSRTINIISWIFGFFLAIWLLGFSLAVPALVFFYLKVQGREGWRLSILLTAAAWLLIWGLFVRLLSLPFPPGQISVWLGWG